MQLFRGEHCGGNQERLGFRGVFDLVGAGGGAQVNEIGAGEC
jgi:hypothetical protein